MSTAAAASSSPSASQPRSAVVVGAGSGIGAATARHLLTAGWQVVAFDLRKEGVDALAEESATGTYPGTLRAVAGDASSADDLAAAVAEAESAAPLGGLVYSAGLEIHGTVTSLSEEEWDRIHAVNLRGVYLAGRAAVPAMAAAGGGSIAVVSSIQGLATERRNAAYAAAKAGSLGLVRAMALDHAADGIRVNAVAPGSIDTPMMRRNAAEFSPEDPEATIRTWAESHALGRIGTPEEVARVIGFLLGDEASFVTGATWTVDGGLLAAF